MNQINIFSDSQSSISIINLNWNSENSWNQNRKKKLEDRGILVNINWAASHADIQDKERQINQQMQLPRMQKRMTKHQQ